MKPNAQVEYRPIKDLKELPGNPRIIKKDQFEKLKQSIKDNADYFEARPIILSDRTGELVILAGNQRYKAAKAIGLKEVPTILLPNLTEKREKEIIIRDNVENGDWDWDALANGWDASMLDSWGVDLPTDLKPQLEIVEDEAPEVQENEPAKSKLVKSYTRPEPRPLELKLKDILEDDVEERYYLAAEQVASFVALQGGNTEPKIVASRGRGEHNMQHLEPRKDDLTNTITSVQKDNYVAEPQTIPVRIGETDSHQKGGVYSDKAIAPTMTATTYKQPIQIKTANKLDGFRIRKLTPRECWRLMGFDDADFDKAQAVGISNTQLYKQAGNSIVVNCLEAIFRGIEWNDD